MPTVDPTPGGAATVSPVCTVSLAGTTPLGSAVTEGCLYGASLHDLAFATYLGPCDSKAATICPSGVVVALAEPVLD